MSKIAFKFQKQVGTTDKVSEELLEETTGVTNQLLVLLAIKCKVPELPYQMREYQKKEYKKYYLNAEIAQTIAEELGII